ncbi:D-lactaldehyde dehydrogenase [Auriscalpium vulgare]|uniref:D-lactaldehyde dehydrogenase n=1 Tax=Auriscalpium vulgare TaxID=40419 RepID=A0ACB8R963_9AGAM|nr:D-lactaldehyde dehydrogenase [Auriscalpium vulgare]
MSPVSAPAKALVTGATGFLAVWVVRRLLEAGYSVRGAVRSESKGAHLKKIFAEYGDKLELAIVEDMSKDGAFDEAVQGVELVEHTASPFHFAAKDPDELIIPAVRGTTSVLESVKKYGSSVKRVVITSSVVAVLGPYTGSVVFDESNWNNNSVSEVTEKGAAAGGFTIYQASKTQAEKAAWAFIDQNKGSISFDLVTIIPPWILGPPIHELNSLDELNTSQSAVLDTISGKKATKAELEREGNWVDVRTVAAAHVAAAQKAEAGGQRIITSTGTFIWQDVLDVANSISPAPFKTIPKGNSGAGKTFPYTVLYDTSKEARILGVTHVPFEQMVVDSVADFKARGYSQ